MTSSGENASLWRLKPMKNKELSVQERKKSKKGVFFRRRKPANPFIFRRFENFSPRFSIRNFSCALNL
jgi:hypothetical protein